MQQNSQRQPILVSQASTSSQPNLGNQANANSHLYISMLLLVPVVFILGIISYRRYRSILFKRQIKMLERVWLIDTSRKMP
jgi:hypothetical protein